MHKSNLNQRFLSKEMVWHNNSKQILSKSIIPLYISVFFFEYENSCTVLKFLVCSFFSDPVSLVRDHNIKQKLGELGISVQSYNGELLYEPWEVFDDKGQAFTTFDAFWDKCLHLQTEPASNLPPWRLVQAAGMFTFLRDI